MLCKSPYLQRLRLGWGKCDATSWHHQHWLVWTREGWLYLAVILDLHSRRVIGWAVSNRMKRDPLPDRRFCNAKSAEREAIRALKMAVAHCGNRPKAAFTIPIVPLGTLHFARPCRPMGQPILLSRLPENPAPAWVKASMSGTGNCYDIAAVETFFKTIKAELLWQRFWRTRRDAEIAIFEYINGFYNPRRRHSALGWKSPLAFEANAA